MRPAWLVLHYTGMLRAQDALDRLRHPEARVSAHYLVTEDGRVLSMVAEHARAWHAGRSFWRGRGSLNDGSIGIEIANPGHAWGLRPFPEAQMVAVIDLSRAVMTRWGLAPHQVLAHSDIAPDRKQDPGERFDWRRMAEAGVGCWPSECGGATPCASEAAALLQRVGYALSSDPKSLRCQVSSFQRRYRPARVDGLLDAETMGRLEALVALLPPPEPTS